MTDHTKTFAYLREQLKAAGLTQAELAGALKVKEWRVQTCLQHGDASHPIASAILWGWLYDGLTTLLSQTGGHIQVDLEEFV